MTDSRKSSNSSSPDAYLGGGSKVEGSLSFSGPVELNGYVQGEVHAQGPLIIGSSAEIHARIEGAEITVRGTVHGDIEARKLLTLEGNAKVYGNIKADKLRIDQGVIFEGSCSMSTQQ